MSTSNFANVIIESLGLKDENKRVSSLAFSSKSSLVSAKSFIFDVPFAMYYLQAPAAKASEVRSFASGIALDNFVLIVESQPSMCFFVIRRARKLNDVSGNPLTLIIPIRNEDDLERIVTTTKKFNFVSNELTAHASITSLYDQLKSGAERYFSNRGLFSTYYLRERLFKALQEHGRNIAKEAETLFSRFNRVDSMEESTAILSALGFKFTSNQDSAFRSYGENSAVLYDLKCDDKIIGAGAVVVQYLSSSSVDSLDTKTSISIAPSYLAVSALRKYPWVILTNGRIWRLYSDKESSVSTDYFEIDLEGVTIETDQRLLYFVSIFSAQSFLPQKNGLTELEITYEGGRQYAQEIETDLQDKVFKGQLFLNLVRAVLDHKRSNRYTKQELTDAKASALKLLYRILFILYAEARGLLPIENSRYLEISFETLRQRLPAFEKDSDATTIWRFLHHLFSAINKGSPEHNVPEYDGALFEDDKELDGISVRNCFIALALHDLAERDSKGIDYQNLGVRHLGSLYEVLLEYSVKQADKELVIFKDEILAAEYAEDLKGKPQGYIPKGELYLSIGGMARKDTGSYYTPDELVSYLVKKGLESHFVRRREDFIKHLHTLRNASDSSQREQLETLCNEVSSRNKSC